MQLIFANKDTHEEFIMCVWKHTNSLCASISKKQPNQIGAQDLNGPFPKEDIEMAKKHMKRRSASVSIGEL